MDTSSPASTSRSDVIVFDDRATLADLQSGHASALAVLHRRHAPAAYWAAVAMVGTPADAEDIVQDAFIVLWRKAKSIELAGISVLPWLLSTTRYLALNFLKARRRRESRLADMAPAAVSDDTTEAAAIAAIELGRIEGLIAAMPQIDRDIYRLCVVEGLCYKQAARRLRTTQPVVRNRLARMRVTFRKGMAR